MEEVADFLKIRQQQINELLYKFDAELIGWFYWR